MPRPRSGEQLKHEVAAWREESIGVVVSLLEDHEMQELGLQEQPNMCAQHGIEFLRFPVPDWGLPGSQEELHRLLAALHTHLLRGQAVAIHCRAGIGRTGVVAGCLLHLLGVPSQNIFHLLSRSRGVYMPATAAQAEWVEQFCRGQDAL